MATFHRTVFSSMTVRLADPTVLSGHSRRDWSVIPGQSVREASRILRRQGRGLARRLIRVTGLFLTVVFSVGAMLGAAMTMSASVAHRTTEIGNTLHLRVLRAATSRRPFCSSRFTGPGRWFAGWPAQPCSIP